MPAELALLHELRRAGSDRRAGVMVDMALAAGVVELDALRRSAGARRLPGAAAYALRRACGECRSPRESDMLQVWEGMAGFPRPLMNREVRDLGGRLLAVVDLLDVEAGVAGEFNGAAHRSAARQSRDERRNAALRGVGIETCAVVGSDRVAECPRRRPVRSPGCPIPHARPSTGIGARFARSAARLCLGILPDSPEPSWAPGPGARVARATSSCSSTAARPWPPSTCCAPPPSRCPDLRPSHRTGPGSAVSGGRH